MLKFIGEPCSLKGKTLLVTAITAGNVPIYALDHLIVLNQFKRVAFLHTEYLEPSVGYLPQNIENGALGLPAELYLHGDVLLLQFRTFARVGRKSALAKQIHELAKAHELSDVIVVGSLPFEEKQDRQISAKQKNIYFKVKGNISSTIMLKKCEQVGMLIPFDDLKDEDEEEDAMMAYGGLSKALLKEFPNLLVLLIFNDKEEDHQTGHFFANQLNTILNRKQLSNVK